MDISSNYKTGILLQGKISEWTVDIIKEYQNNFPSSTILLSTWTTENVENIPCDVIQIQPPDEQDQIGSYTINHQIIGTRAGLEKIQCDIVMKCRTDQFIHNSKIFEIFETSCSKDRIMVPNNGNQDSIDYYISDYCQIATRNILLQYWNLMPFFNDPHLSISPESYLTKNYLLKIKKDSKPWKSVINDYFVIRSFYLDFQIEWEKMIKSEPYRVQNQTKDIKLNYYNDINYVQKNL